MTLVFCCYNQHIKQNNRIVLKTDWQTDRQSYRRTYLEEQKRPHKETKEESLPCGQTDKCMQPNKAHTIACWDQELHDAPSLAMCSIILYGSPPEQLDVMPRGWRWDVVLFSNVWNSLLLTLSTYKIHAFNITFVYVCATRFHAAMGWFNSQIIMMNFIWENSLRAKEEIKKVWY